MRISRKNPGFTLVELMIVVMIIGILASVAITSFQSYFARAKASEAMMSLEKITSLENEYYQKNNSFLEAGPTNIPPSPLGPTTADFSGSSWNTLGFNIPNQVYFGYQVTLNSATSINCEAMADLNGDGVASLYRRVIDVTGGSMSISNTYIFDELE